MSAIYWLWVARFLKNYVTWSLERVQLFIGHYTRAFTLDIIQSLVLGSNKTGVLRPKNVKMLKKY
ncbi:hypothetical protein JCM31598_33120 [Desulfonatronum parangueonense]